MVLFPGVDFGDELGFSGFGGVRDGQVVAELAEGDAGSAVGPSESWF